MVKYSPSKYYFVFNRIRGEVFMRELLYGITEMIARIHNYIMHVNDRFEYDFSDKDLHFLVIGILGMLMIFVVYPLFKWLADKKHVMVIAWIYVFTLIIVITFAIEIGQKISNTGNMEFADIMFGVMGFIVMFAVFAVIRGIYHGIRWLATHKFVERGQAGGEDVKQENPDSSSGEVNAAYKNESDKSENVMQADNQHFTQYEYKFSDEDIQMIAKLSDKENDNADTEKVTEEL